MSAPMSSFGITGSGLNGGSRHAVRTSLPPPQFWKPASASMRRWMPLKIAPSAVKIARMASAALRTLGAGRRLRATSSMSSTCELHHRAQDTGELNSKQQDQAAGRDASRWATFP